MSTKYWDLARLILLVLTSLPSFGLCVCVLFLVRGQRHPGRSWIKPFKLTLVLFLTYFVWSMVGYAIRVTANFTVNMGPYGSDDAQRLSIVVASDETLGVSSLFGNLTEVSILLLLTRLVISMKSIDYAEEPLMLKFVRRTVLGVAVVCAILAAIAWALKVYVFQSGDTGDSHIYILTYVRLELAIASILIAPSVLVGRWYLMAALQQSDNPNKRVAKLLTRCTGLWLLSLAYQVGSTAQYIRSISDVAESVYYVDEDVLYLIVLEVVLFCWPILALLIVLYNVVGIRPDGIWTTKPPPTQANPDMGSIQQPYRYQYVYHEVAEGGARSLQHWEMAGSVQPPPTELEEPHRDHEMPA